MQAIERDRSSQTTPGVEPRSRPSSDGVGVGLFIVIAGALGVMTVYGEVFVDAMAFLVVFGALGVAAIRRPSPRLRWVIAVLLTLFVAVNLIYAIGDLTHPESPAPFIATAVVVGGGLVTIVLAVMAARHRRVPTRRVGVSGLAALTLVSIASLVAASRVQDDVALAGDTAVKAENSSYPDEVVVDSASTAVILRNADPFRHTFVIDGYGSPVELPAGSRVRVGLDLSPGTYRFFCDVPGHEAMAGSLVVR